MADIVAAEVNVAVCKCRGKSDGALGVKAPDGLSGVRVDAVHSVVNGASEVSASIGHDYLHGVIEINPMLHLVAFDRRGARAFPGLDRLRWRLVLPCQRQRQLKLARSEAGSIIAVEVGRPVSM